MVWFDPFKTLRAPYMFDLRADPFERAKDEGMDYNRWAFERAFYVVPVQGVVKGFVDTLKDYPPRAKSASFGIDQILDAASTGAGKAAAKK
jgi:arylsulfatase